MNIGKYKLNFSFENMWKITNGGYLPLFILAFGFGKNGIGFFLLNFYFGLSVTEKEDEK